MDRGLIKAWLTLLFVLGGLVQTRAGQPSGTIYLVVGSDTAIWNGGGTVDVYTRYPYYRQDSFTDSNAPIYQVMDPAWRQQFKDSYGQPIKFTWWMMGGNIYRDAVNLNVPLANTMTLHLMRQYHGEAIRQFGDELSLHYHTYKWTDYNGNGVYYWNQTQTFEECRADFEVTLAQYLLEEQVFPVSFRSGWHFMDEGWQAYLDQLLPYSYHNNYPARQPWYTNSGPIGGVEDWSRAPAAFIPFHPATNDYQVPGDGPGWETRSVKLQSLTQPMLDQMFSNAVAGVDQVACFWDHLPENFVANIVRMNTMLEQAGSSHPGVSFRYCTAIEAMQRWRGLTNEPPPELTVVQDLRGPTLSLTITSSVPIFQPRPFVCFRDAFQQYSNVTADCHLIGANSWAIDLGLPTNLLAKVSVAVTDMAGNLATQTLRFLPDDLFLDNRDSQYSEPRGKWTTITNAAWGVDARAALLDSNTAVSAAWALPITWSGRYRLSVQAPALMNSATGTLFKVMAAETNVQSIFLPAGLPTNQWVFIASVLLDGHVTNRVEMTVDGAHQPGAYAVADVLRVEPVSELTLPAVSNQTPIAVLRVPEGFLVRFAARAGMTCTVQRSGNVSGGWTAQGVISTATPGMLEYLDSKPPAGESFYRVLEQ